MCLLFQLGRCVLRMAVQEQQCRQQQQQQPARAHLQPLRSCGGSSARLMLSKHAAGGACARRSS